MRGLAIVTLATGCFIEPARPLDRDAHGGGDGAGSDSGTDAVPGTANYLYVTSGSFTLNMAHSPAQRLADAEMFCQTAAFNAIPTSPVRGGHYKPWLSGNGMNAADVIAATSARAWRRTDGAPIAATLAELGSGTLRNPPQYDENGSDQGVNVRAMTGTTFDGLIVPGADIGCSGGHVEIGVPSSATATWTDTGYDFCTTTTLRLYCLGYDIKNGQL